MFVALLVGPHHPLHEPALGLFRRVVDGALGLVVTPIVVAELVYVSRSLLRWPRGKTAERVGSLLQADGLILMERAAILSALDLYGRRARLDFADAYLAATAVRTGPPVVASFDGNFDRMAGLRRITG